MKNNLILSIINSILLGAYLLMTLWTDLISMNKYVIFIKTGLYLLPFLLFVVFRLRFSIFNLLSMVVFGGSFCFCLLKGFTDLTIIYVITAPILAQFVIVRKFNLIILYVVFCLISLVFLNAALQDALDSFMLCSRNYVSVKLLFVSVLITIIYYRQNKKVILWPALVTLILSVMAIGRGGILCSSINFLGLLYLKYIRNSRVGFKLSLAVLVISAAVYYWPQIEDVYETSEQLEHLREQGLEDSTREYLWEEYFSKIDLITIVTGVNLNECPLIHHYKNNPHNSYIYLHAYLGIFVLIPLYLLLYALYKNIQVKEFIFVFPLLALMVRCFSDISMLSYYDFIFWIFIIHTFGLKNRQEKSIGVKIYSN